MKIVDMGRGKPKGKDKDGMPPVAWGGEEEGPRVRLDPERTKKMFGTNGPPAPGTEHRIEGHARVVGSQEEPRSDGGEGPVHSIEIVIHHMGAEPKDVAEEGRKSVRNDVEEAAKAVEGRDRSSTRPTSVEGKAQREKSQRSQAPAEQKSW